MDLEKSLYDVLMDENDDRTISFYDLEGNEIEFAQTAVIPLESGLYAIMKPVDPSQIGVSEDEVMLFVLCQDEEGDYVLEMERDEEVIKAVWEEYEKLVDESEG